MLWNVFRVLHERSPYFFLRLWGSSEKLISLSRRLALGGKTYDQFYNLSMDMQNWSSDKIYEFQFDRLRKLLEHVHRNVPYYQKMFNKECLRPSDIKCLEDLQKLPVLTKDDVLKNYKQFFARNLWYKNRMYRHTSGTSGKSLKVYKDKESVCSTAATVQYFRKTFLGYTSGNEMVLNSPVSTNNYYSFLSMGKSDGFYSPVAKVIVFSWPINDQVFEKYIEYIKKFNIKRVEGLPSIFFSFANYLKDKDKTIKLKTALFLGEMLYDHQRKFIEKQLGCEIFNMYTQVESSVFACECFKHKGMHISPLMGITEVKNHGMGGEGEIIGTHLWNYFFPLIRYDTKDVVVLSQKKCGCGCNFPQRLIQVEGRNNDFIRLPDGGYLHPMPFTWFNISIRGIKDIFFLQDENYNLNIFVVKEENSNADKIKGAIEQKVRTLSNNKLKIKIIFTDHIERKSRKYKIVETKVATPLKHTIDSE